MIDSIPDSIRVFAMEKWLGPGVAITAASTFFSDKSADISL